MSGEPTTTLIGNLVADPELRFTPSGSAVANFTIAVTPRTFDRQANEWKDGETLFARCSLWREAAQNASQTLTKGMRVIAEAFIKSRTYQTKEGENRTVTEYEVQEIGPSLRYATAQVQRTQNNGNGGQQQAQGGGGFGGQQPQGGGFGGGFPGAQQAGGFPGQQPAQGPNSQWGNGQAQQPQGQPQQQPAQHYAQAAAAGPQAGPQAGAQQYAQAPAAQGAQQPYQQLPADDPWATPGVSNAGGQWGPGQEPPF